MVASNLLETHEGKDGTGCRLVSASPSQRLSIVVSPILKYNMLKRKLVHKKKRANTAFSNYFTHNKHSYYLLLIVNVHLHLYQSFLGFRPQGDQVAYHWTARGTNH